MVPADGIEAESKVVMRASRTPDPYASGEGRLVWQPMISESLII